MSVLVDAPDKSRVAVVSFGINSTVSALSVRSVKINSLSALLLNGTVLSANAGLLAQVTAPSVNPLKPGTKRLALVDVAPLSNVRILMILTRRPVSAFTGLPVLLQKDNVILNRGMLIIVLAKLSVERESVLAFKNGMEIDVHAYVIKKPSALNTQFGMDPIATVLLIRPVKLLRIFVLEPIKSLTMLPALAWKECLPNPFVPKPLVPVSLIRSGMLTYADVSALKLRNVILVSSGIWATASADAPLFLTALLTLHGIKISASVSLVRNVLLSKTLVPQTDGFKINANASQPVGK
jgi:hypothetical protein